MPKKKPRKTQAKKSSEKLQKAKTLDLVTVQKGKSSKVSKSRKTGKKTPVKGNTGGGTNDSPSDSKKIRPPGKDHFVVAFDLILSNFRATSTDAERETCHSRWKALQESARIREVKGDDRGAMVVTAQRVALTHNVGATKALHDEYIILNIAQAHEFLATRPELGNTLPTLVAYRRSFLKRFKRVLGRHPTKIGSEDRPRYLMTYAEILVLEDMLGVQSVSELAKSRQADIDELGGVEEYD